MVISGDNYGSPEKKEVLADIGRREKLATQYEDKISADRRNLDFARGSYVHIARLYEQIGEHEKANAARKAAASLGRGLRDYLPKKEVKVYDLDTELSGVASAFAIAFGAFFMAPQLTGNVIGNSGVEMSCIGSVIFLCGLLGLYGFVKRKK